MGELPGGTVTFLFTDIEGSTGLWQAYPAAMRRAYARHDAIVRGAVEQQGGTVFKTVGDAFQAALPTAPGGVAAALEALLGLEFEDWAALGLPAPLRVRMALHAGDVDPGPDGDYRSPVLNRLGRLLAAGHGGQALASQAVRQLAREGVPADADWRDLGQHRLRDLLEPERISQLVHPALPDEFAPLATLDARPHNLPVQPTPFLGREHEVARAVELLRRHDVQLVTLTGPGGTGKTRLGLQVAAELLDDFADGVFFVPLALLTDPDHVPAAIAEAVGVRDAGARPLPDLLRGALASMRVLLLLDNLEQVAGAAPFVAELLTAAPGLTVLVTSRVPLRLRAEREVPVPPLPLPARHPPPTAAQLAQYEVVRLFVERAQAVKPDFAVSDENAPAVAEVCRRLDGLPLAIELAAARVKLLPPQAMLARLDQRLPLLTGGARDLPARQQTLRGAIAWSYDLLSPDEQGLFRRLAVFASGWTLEAAEAVAGSPDTGELGLDVLEGLALLVDHSLVRAGGDGEEPRFAMLETIREYGFERLDEAGEAAEARARHAAFFLALAEAAKPGLTGPDQAAWLTRLEVEHDNLRAALAWALQHDPEGALRLGAPLWRFWWYRGHAGEGWEWLERALAGGGGAPGVRAAALEAAGRLAWVRGDHDRAEVLAEESLALYRRLGDRRGIADALSATALALHDQGASARGTAVLEEELALRRELGDRRGVGITLNNLGDYALLDGEEDHAVGYYEEAVAALREVGEASSLAISLLNLGLTRAVRGDTRAWRHLREVAELARRLGNREHQAWVLTGAAALAQRAGQPREAARLLGAAGAMWAEVGVPLPSLERTRWHDPVVAAIRAELGETASDAAWAKGRTLPLDEALNEALAIGDEIAAAGTGNTNLG